MGRRRPAPSLEKFSAGRRSGEDKPGRTRPGRRGRRSGGGFLPRVTGLRHSRLPPCQPASQPRAEQSRETSRGRQSPRQLQELLESQVLRMHRAEFPKDRTGPNKVSKQASRKEGRSWTPVSLSQSRGPRKPPGEEARRGEAQSSPFPPAQPPKKRRCCCCSESCPPPWVAASACQFASSSY